MENNQKYEPDLVVWEITLKCNLKCRHCSSSAGEARHDELSTKESLNLCDDLAELGFKGVTLFGVVKEDHLVTSKLFGTILYTIDSGGG